MDHFSRRVHGLAVFAQPPTAKQMRDMLSRIVSRLGKAPRHLITDQGKQFSGEVFSDWCRQRGIRQRFGAVGMHGSIAVIERMIRIVKQECMRALPVISLRRRSVQRELQLFLDWYHADRPHTGLEGATPDEVYYRTRPACHRPRFEPRPGWPRASPCAKPRVLVKGQPGAKLELRVEFRSSRRHLPQVLVTRAA
jgi:putative transposase